MAGLPEAQNSGSLNVQHHVHDTRVQEEEEVWIGPSSTRMPGNGGLYAWEFGKGRRELKVRVD